MSNEKWETIKVSFVLISLVTVSIPLLIFFKIYFSFQTISILPSSILSFLFSLFVETPPLRTVITLSSIGIFFILLALVTGVFLLVSKTRTPFFTIGVVVQTLLFLGLLAISIFFMVVIFRYFNLKQTDNSDTVVQLLNYFLDFSVISGLQSLVSSMKNYAIIALVFSALQVVLVSPLTFHAFTRHRSVETEEELKPLRKSSGEEVSNFSSLSYECPSPGFILDEKPATEEEINKMPLIICGEETG
jgi:hypothetical protein